MRFGVTIFLGSRTIPVTTLARACEELGFESLFLPEHTHVPVARESAYEPERDGGIPPEFMDVVDPFVGLAAAAAVTERLGLATGLCLIAQRDPILVAKEVATIDLVSRGRMRLGIGPGWNREEMSNHGVNPRHRHRILEESAQALREIWTNEVASFEGEHVRFDRMWQWPKPVQQPHPPILIGGSGPKVLGRVVAYGDGWLASTKREGEEELPARVAELQQLANEAGRQRIPVTLQRAEATHAAIERYRRSDIDECTFGLSSADEAVVIAELKELAALIESHR